MSILFGIIVFIPIRFFFSSEDEFDYINLKTEAESDDEVVVFKQPRGAATKYRVWYIILIFFYYCTIRPNKSFPNYEESVIKYIKSIID